MIRSLHDLPDEIGVAYERQRAAHRTERDVIPSLLSQPNTIDAWRHRRMYEPIKPIVEKSDSWLTVGDSGADAFWLNTQGVSNVTASSITDHQLKNLQSRGMLKAIEVREINAEKIELEDGAVDFVLCKEAFHHFPRPLVGFYEMLRVCRKGVVLLAEPYDDRMNRPLNVLKDFIKRLIRRNTPMENSLFEPSGNYIYGVSLDEIHKAAIALQLPGIYYLRMNDFFHHSISRKPIDHSQSRKLTKFAVGVQDSMAKAGLLSWGSVTVVVLKQPLKETAKENLGKVGFKSCDIPINPFIAPNDECSK